MSITQIEYQIFSRLRESGVFPPRPTVLELGESNWYGDMPTEWLSDCIESLVADAAVREKLHRRMVDALCAETETRGWDLAKIFYKVFLDYSKIAAIDFHGSPAALALDLNNPVDLGEQYDVLINIGTAEHVFNVWEFFRTCHRVTKPGGIMVHVMPFLGWIEHGFYSFNPTFYWDLAMANGYTLMVLAYTELNPPKVVQLLRREQIVEMAQSGALGRNANLYAIMKKGAAESDFRAPIQGFYAGNVSQEMSEAWFKLR